MPPNSPAAIDQPPHAHDFAAQIIRQLYADLDGVLIDGEYSVLDSFSFARSAALAARPRGAVMLVIARSALSAHGTLVSAAEPATAEFAEAEAAAAVAAMLPEVAPQLPALAAHARDLTQQIATAENSPEAIDAPLARAITRFCTALGNEDAAVGGRALLELRAIVIHLDACAQVLEASTTLPTLLRVARPDRFHDYFTQYVDLARKPAAAAGDSVRAALTSEGRITAVIAADEHPLETAARTVKASIVGDETTRDHVLARIHALLDFLDGLRGKAKTLIGDPFEDENVHLSLVIAAATTPLNATAGFGFSELAEVARYNQLLLRGAKPGNARPD